MSPASTAGRLVFGQRLRHFRRRAGLTLAGLGELVGRPAPYLSQLENGHNQPRLPFVGELAAALGCDTAELLEPTPPSRRAELEITLASAQEDPLYQELNLPYLKPSTRLPDDILEHVVSLYQALSTAAAPPVPTRGQRRSDRARLANVALRDEMRSRDNYFPEIEALATRALASVNYSGSGPVSERTLMDLCELFDFTIARVQDLPASARSITDQRGRIIYIGQRDALPTRAARSVVLQTLGHFALEHTDTDDLDAYLRQRVESNYFAAAVLAPERPAADFLDQAKAAHDLSVEDLKEIFYISYEMAAHRFTNLATRHLDLTVHFLRSDDAGVVWKAYENDDVPLPLDDSGSVEGRKLCREWGTRQAFRSEDSFALHYQYTDTPTGRFWCGTHVEAGRTPFHAVTVGTTAEQAKWFRGSNTDRSSVSGCPDPNCCRTPSDRVRGQWEDVAWPSASDRSHVIARAPAEGLPFSRFPGVDMVDVYQFLERRS